MTTEAAHTDTTAVDRFLEAVATAGILAADAWTPDAVLDATVPNWRFSVRGADKIREVYSGWFKDPAQFEEVRRLPTPSGLVLEYVLIWEEDGVPHAGHHAHLLTLADDGRITEDRVFCGGRWDAALLARMEGAAG